MRLDRLGVQQDGADGEQPAGRIEDRRAVGARQAGEHRGIDAGRRAALQHVQQLRRGRRVDVARRAAARRADRRAPPAAAATSPGRAGRRTARLRARRRDRAPSGTAARRARRCRPTRAHISYLACRSSRCQRALRKLKTCTPSAKTLISCDGLSTTQTLRLPAVASACERYGVGHGTSSRAGSKRRAISTMSST